MAQAKQPRLCNQRANRRCDFFLARSWLLGFPLAFGFDAKTSYTDEDNSGGRGGKPPHSGDFRYLGETMCRFHCRNSAEVQKFKSTTVSPSATVILLAVD